MPSARYSAALLWLSLLSSDQELCAKMGAARAYEEACCGHPGVARPHLSSLQSEIPRKKKRSRKLSNHRNRGEWPLRIPAAPSLSRANGPPPDLLSVWEAWGDAGIRHPKVVEKHVFWICVWRLFQTNVHLLSRTRLLSPLFLKPFLDYFNPECHVSPVSPRAFLLGRHIYPVSLLVIFVERDRAGLLRGKALERGKTCQV